MKPTPRDSNLQPARLAGLIAASLLMALSTGLAAQIAAPDARRAQPLLSQTNQYILENGQIRLDFATSGTGFELQSLLNKSPGSAPIGMQPGSGSWTVRLMLADGLAKNWFEFSMDGSSTDNTGGLGSLDALSLDSVDATAAKITVTWSGSVTIAGATTDFTIETDWSLMTARPVAETSLHIQLDQTGLPYYVTHATYPLVMVSAFPGPGDQLVVPWGTGTLIEHPTQDAECLSGPSCPPGQENCCFPDWLGKDSNNFPVSVAAYYDDGSPSNCFIYSASDADDYWKDLRITAAKDAGPVPGHVGFDFRHVPDDVFDNTNYQTPYSVRLGAIQGDWWDVAAAYRQFLIDDAVPWYHGPMGSPANPMPLDAKLLVAEVFFQPGFQGDLMDVLNRQMLDLTRVLGPNVQATWYGSHATDYFHEGDYLPPRPSLRAAIMEAQKQFNHLVSVYFNGTNRSDCFDPALPPSAPPCTPFLLEVQDAFLLDEDGQPRYLVRPQGPPRAAPLCPGNAWWQDTFVQNVVDIAEFNGMKALYMDYFLTGLCYSLDHEAAPTGHAPGGGNWMNTDRMDQVRGFKAMLGNAFTVTMEFLIGRFAEEVHLMHTDPAGNLISLEKPGTPGASPMDNAVTIPFFRAIYDSVKLSRITTKFPSPADRRAWVDANNVVTFGQIPQVTRPLPEQIPIFSQRFVYASFFNYGGAVDPQDPLGEGAESGNDDEGLGGTIPGEGSTVNTFAPGDALATPYYSFLHDLTEALRDDDFLRWHNGTLRRLPLWQIDAVTPPTFTDDPGVELDPGGAQTNTPVYIEEYLTPGMYQAAPDMAGPDADSLAFILTNPWVDPTQPATFDLSFVFQPHLYPGWTNTTVYTVTRSGVGIVDLPLGGPRCGAFFHADTMAPGDIVWWVFRKVPGVCPP